MMRNVNFLKRIYNNQRWAIVMILHTIAHLYRMVYMDNP